jgi:hypothetical protein
MISHLDDGSLDLYHGWKDATSSAGLLLLCAACNRLGVACNSKCGCSATTLCRALERKKGPGGFLQLALLGGAVANVAGSNAAQHCAQLKKGRRARVVSSFLHLVLFCSGGQWSLPCLPCRLVPMEKPFLWSGIRCLAHCLMGTNFTGWVCPSHSLRRMLGLHYMLALIHSANNTLFQRDISSAHAGRLHPCTYRRRPALTEK